MKKTTRNLTGRKRNEKGQWIRAINEEELDDKTFIDDVSESKSIIYEESDSEFCFEGGSVPEELFMIFWYVTPKLRIFDILPLILWSFC